MFQENKSYVITHDLFALLIIEYSVIRSNGRHGCEPSEGMRCRAVVAGWCPGKRRGVPYKTKCDFALSTITLPFYNIIIQAWEYRRVIWLWHVIIRFNVIITGISSLNMFKLISSIFKSAQFHGASGTYFFDYICVGRYTRGIYQLSGMAWDN